MVYSTTKYNDYFMKKYHKFLIFSHYHILHIKITITYYKSCWNNIFLQLKVFIKIMCIRILK
jgi:hypothetical protein